MQIDDYIIETLMRDLVGHDHSSSGFLVYLFFWQKAEGDKTKKILASYSRIAFATGLSKSAVQGAIKSLMKRKLLVQTKRSLTATPAYSIRLPWRRLKMV